jgi:membrane protease YdiL (CAAX protease family)
MSDGPRIPRWWLGPPAVLIVLVVIAANTAAATDSRNGVYQGSQVLAALATAIVLGGYALLAARLSRVPVAAALALRRPPDRGQAVRLVIAAVALITAVSLALEPFLHGDRDQGLTPTRTPHGHEWLVLAAALAVLGLLTPLCEELLFRGLGFACLDRHAVPVTSIAFAAAHALPALLIPVLVAGFALGEVRRRTHSLWPGVATHVTINTAGILVALLTSM